MMAFVVAGGHREHALPRRTTAAPQRTLLVAAHTDRGALDDHARQTLAAAALIADAADRSRAARLRRIQRRRSRTRRRQAGRTARIRPAQFRAGRRTERARGLRRRVCAGARLPARQRNRRRRPRPPIRGASECERRQPCRRDRCEARLGSCSGRQGVRSARPARSDPSRAERGRSEAAVRGRGRARRGHRTSRRRKGPTAISASRRSTLPRSHSKKRISSYRREMASPMWLRSNASLKRSAPR